MEAATTAPEGGEGPSFFLVPINKAAMKVIQEPANRPWLFEYEEGRHALHISFAAPDRLRITMGRSGTDIYIPDAKGADISKRHCTFIYSQQTGAVVLYDQSKTHNTEVYDTDDDRIVPISKASHSIVVSRGFNRKLAIGTDKHYRFELQWYADVIDEFTGARARHFGPWGTGVKEFRYIKGEEIGAGGFGAVWKAIDLRNGDAMAVKRFHTLEGKGHLYAAREVNNMFKLNESRRIKHDHILEIFDYVYDEKGEKWLEIFMPLKDGSLKNLAKTEGVNLEEIGRDVLYQMLHALKCTAAHGIVHRDIKPDNILYDIVGVTDDDRPIYHFWLGDFGLSNDAAKALTKAGTEPFMAPEVIRRAKQTPKMDIWSLFATLVWVYNTQNFRTRCWTIERVEDIHQWLVHIAQLPEFAHMEPMARIDPEERISAARLLRQLEAQGGQAGGAGQAVGPGGFADIPEEEELIEDFEQKLAFRVEASEGSSGSSTTRPGSSQQLWNHYAVGSAPAETQAGPSVFAGATPRGGYGPQEDDEEASHGQMGVDYLPPSNNPFGPNAAYNPYQNYNLAEPAAEKQHRDKGKGRSSKGRK